MPRKVNLKNGNAVAFKERFTEEFMKNGENATQAWISAGGAEKNARMKACGYLKKHPDIREKVSVEKEKVSKNLGYTLEKQIKMYIQYIDEARAQGNQYSAVANLMKEFSKLTGVHPDVNKSHGQAPFTLVINTGTNQMKEARKIEYEMIASKPEEDDDESDSDQD